MSATSLSRPPAADHPATSRTTATRRLDVPVIVYRLVVALAAGLTLSGSGGLLGLPAPWANVGGAHPHHVFELHRWHITDISALVSLLLVGALLASAWRPRGRALVLQGFLGGALVFAAVSALLPDPAVVLGPVGVLVGLVLAAYPERRSLLRLPLSGRRQPAALLAAAIATPFLLTNAWSNVGQQLGGADPHAALGHWAGAAAVVLALLLCTWLAATGGPGARTLSAVVAVTWLYLGAAALLLPQHDGSWGPTGGAVALGVSALVLWGVRSPGRSSR